MEKDFDEWNKVKKRTHGSEHFPLFREREIWWCKIGLNVGNEEDGKNQNFLRPVLIVRKFNSRFFIGIPLTTQVKDNPYYTKIIFDNNEICAMISQIKSLSCKRLTDKMGILNKNQFEKICKQASALFISQPPFSGG